MNKNQKAINVVVALVCLITASTIGVYVGRLRGIPFVTTKWKWSIGIYVGESPHNLVSPGNIGNPVLTARDVTDIPAGFVADPFMVKEDSTWYMFFEVMNAQTDQGDIGLATSDDGFSWVYKQIVLDEAFHLSYPYVFKWKTEYYMIPETYQTNSIRLYKAMDFPREWSFAGTLLKGYPYMDTSVVHFDSRWWMFTSTADDTLRLYYADELMGPWTEHPQSPVIEKDENIARPGGRLIVLGGKVVRYTQDGDPTYGNQVRVFEITRLTTASYEEKEMSESPILRASGAGWNARAMHHIDPHQTSENEWIACVDGATWKFWFFGYGPLSW